MKSISILPIWIRQWEMKETILSERVGWALSGLGYLQAQQVTRQFLHQWIHASTNKDSGRHYHRSFLSNWQAAVSPKSLLFSHCLLLNSLEEEPGESWRFHDAVWLSCVLCGPPLFLHSGCFNTKETATQLEPSEQFRALSLLFLSSLENVGGYFLANILSLFILRFQLCTYNKQTNRGYFWMCHSFQFYCMCHLGYFNVCFSVLFIKYPVNSIQSIFSL